MLFIATCVDKPQSLDTRLANRPAQLTYLEGLGSKVKIGGSARRRSQDAGRLDADLRGRERNSHPDDPRRGPLRTRRPGLPPKIDTPASRTIATTSSSRPSPLFCTAVSRRNVHSTPARAQTSPETMNRMVLIRLTRMPAKRAASALLPWRKWTGRTGWRAGPRRRSWPAR